MYKTANKNQQFSASRHQLRELENGDLALTDSEKRACLVARYQWLVEQNKFEKNKEKRKENGLALFELMNQISAIRPKQKLQDLSHYIINIVRGSMTKHQWSLVIAEAQELMRKDEQSGQFESVKAT